MSIYNKGGQHYETLPIKVILYQHVFPLRVCKLIMEPNETSLPLKMTYHPQHPIG